MAAKWALDCFELDMENVAMRMLVFAATVSCLAMTSPAFSQASASDRDNGRFTFRDVPDGVLRLDSRSGQVSLCKNGNNGWACQALPDDRAAFEEEITRLERENASLKKTLAARGVPVPDGTAPRSAPEARLPSDDELDRVMALFEKMWRRLAQTVQKMQREIDTK
jgi:hypothetical protein